MDYQHKRRLSIEDSPVHNNQHISLYLYVLVVLLSILSLQTIHCAPFVNKSDNGVDIDVWPFFKMHLARGGQQTGKLLDIEVLSGMIKVNVDKTNGGRPQVNVEVFGLGGGNGGTKKSVPVDDLDDDDLDAMKLVEDNKNNNI